MSLRCVRSPDAPKMTSANGSSAYGMATELVAKRGEQPVRERIVTPRAEAREERGGDGGRRHRPVDGVFHRPPAPARVLDIWLEGVELRIGRQPRRRPFEPPPADDGSPVPGPGGPRQGGAPPPG